MRVDRANLCVYAKISGLKSLHRISLKESSSITLQSSHDGRLKPFMTCERYPGDIPHRFASFSFVNLRRFLKSFKIFNGGYFLVMVLS